MKKTCILSFRSIMTAATLFLLVPFLLRAQSSSTSPGIEEFKKRLEELERTTHEQIEALRQLIKEQEETISRLHERKAQTSAEVQASQSRTPSAVPYERETSAAARDETFSRSQDSAPRINNTPLDPSLQGFFQIPGTPARLKFDGYAKLDLNFDPRPAGNIDQFINTTIPVNVAPNAESANVNIHARQTRFSLDFRSPTVFGEDLRVYFEGDFYGPNGGTDPRLRHYYGQLKNFLLGQTWTAFADPDAIPDTLDFQGPAGIVVTRQVQVRYTQPLRQSQSLTFSVERPSVQTRTLFAEGYPITPYPDAVVRWRQEKRMGHIQVGTLYRGIGYSDGTRKRTIFGWGVNITGGIRVVGRDQFQFYGSYGEGMARYVENLDGLGLDLDLNNQSTDLKALPVIASYGAYKHYWAQRVRSTVTFGYDRVQNTVPQPEKAFNKSYYMSGNLLFNLIGSLDMGVEFLHGWQVMKDDSKGNANWIQLSFKYDLYRKDEQP
jgi:hypothetical protein